MPGYCYCLTHPIQLHKPNTAMKYWSIRITQANGHASYLSNRDRSAWTRRHAQRLAREFRMGRDVMTTLEPAECYETA